ncbi:uncharacterized protein LOC104862257 isoform X1 [Fukomys damarensis]|uniref:uncharacterized protein LOC104862257 isoform X1 n=1 Tax=Fukomys damarensis TaxID=885580 RepID=UPI00054002DB|nr:uncharacterized protein LOC104862257 isoform X1 [Fukomys damarensis]
MPRDGGCPRSHSPKPPVRLWEQDQQTPTKMFHTQQAAKSTLSAFLEFCLFLLVVWVQTDSFLFSNRSRLVQSRQPHPSVTHRRAKPHSSPGASIAPPAQPGLLSSPPSKHLRRCQPAPRIIQANATLQRNTTVLSNGRIDPHSPGSGGLASRVLLGITWPSRKSSKNLVVPLSPQRRNRRCSQQAQERSGAKVGETHELSADLSMCKITSQQSQAAPQRRCWFSHLGFQGFKAEFSKSSGGTM